MALHLDIAPGEHVTVGDDITVTVEEKGCSDSRRARLVLDIPIDQRMMVRFGDEIRIAVREKTGRRMCMSFTAPREIEIERHRAEQSTDPSAHECHTSHKGGTHGTHNRGSERP